MGSTDALFALTLAHGVVVHVRAFTRLFAVTALGLPLSATVAAFRVRRSVGVIAADRSGLRPDDAVMWMNSRGAGDPKAAFPPVIGRDSVSCDGQPVRCSWLQRKTAQPVGK